MGGEVGLIVKESVHVSFAEGTLALPEEDAFPGLQTELLEELSVHLVNSVVGVL